MEQEKAKDKALEWLNEKGITISDTELEILIEASVNSFNNGIKEASKQMPFYILGGIKYE